VFVIEGGFSWQGQTYPSLSAIAKEITGTRWNGWRFFACTRIRIDPLHGRGGEGLHEEALAAKAAALRDLHPEIHRA
jgi:hypothetical protein